MREIDSESLFMSYTPGTIPKYGAFRPLDCGALSVQVTRATIQPNGVLMFIYARPRISEVSALDWMLKSFESLKVPMEGFGGMGDNLWRPFCKTHVGCIEDEECLILESMFKSA